MALPIFAGLLKQSGHEQRRRHGCRACSVTANGPDTITFNVSAFASMKEAGCVANRIAPAWLLRGSRIAKLRVRHWAKVANGIKSLKTAGCRPLQGQTRLSAPGQLLQIEYKWRGFVCIGDSPNWQSCLSGWYCCPYSSASSHIYGLSREYQSRGLNICRYSA